MQYAWESVPCAVQCARDNYMAEPAPVADATPVAAAADDASVLDTAAPAEGKAADAAPDPKESKPADKAGDDGAKAEPDLLADDDEGKTPDKVDGQADTKTGETPETYEAFTFPEGVQVDEAVLAQATPIFKDVGLNQEQAQKLVSLYAGMQQEAAAQQIAGFNQVKNDWKAAIKADPEFGGDKLKNTVGDAMTVIGKFGDKELLSDLKEWGWANHPGLIRLLARVKANLSEDTLVTADTTAQPGAQRSAAEVLWPSMFKQE